MNLYIFKNVIMSGKIEDLVSVWCFVCISLQH